MVFPWFSPWKSHSDRAAQAEAQLELREPSHDVGEVRLCEGRIDAEHLCHGRGFHGYLMSIYIYPAIKKSHSAPWVFIFPNPSIFSWVFTSAPVGFSNAHMLHVWYIYQAID